MYGKHIMYYITCIRNYPYIYIFGKLCIVAIHTLFQYIFDSTYWANCIVAPLLPNKLTTLTHHKTGVIGAYYCTLLTDGLISVFLKNLYKT